MKHLSLPALVALGLMAVALGGCDKLVDTSRAVQEVSKQAFNDTKSSWLDFFTYHPPQEDPLPQTRYCYQSQADIVCYDSDQPQLTSKLVGYQHGDSVAWIQPGGGSTGASGGEPQMLRPPRVVKSASNTSNQTQVSYDVDTSPMPPARLPATTGEISVDALPPTRNGS